MVKAPPVSTMHSCQYTLVGTAVEGTDSVVGEAASRTAVETAHTVAVVAGEMFDRTKAAEVVSTGFGTEAVG